MHENHCIFVGLWPRECFHSRDSEDICCFSGEPPGRCYERYKQPGLADQTAHFCTIHILIEGLNDCCTDYLRTLQVREAAATSICRLGVTERIPHNAAGLQIVSPLVEYQNGTDSCCICQVSMIHFRSRIQFCFDTRVKVCIQSLVKRGLTDSCAEVRQVVC